MQKNTVLHVKSKAQVQFYKIEPVSVFEPQWVPSALNDELF